MIVFHTENVKKFVPLFILRTEEVCKAMLLRMVRLDFFLKGHLM